MKSKPTNIYTVKSERGIADKLVHEVGANKANNYNNANTIVIDDYNWYKDHKKEIDDLVKSGKTSCIFRIKRRKIFYWTK